MFNGGSQYISRRKGPAGSKAFHDVDGDEVMAFSERSFSVIKASSAA